ncbi:3-isopropylmalate dehydratase large subunit [Pseudobacteriovorax antillogorgiicola]|uniref:3-isopropylmalate dehydratase n=1 Tax=Pseudobacteriovorax antillogorgiicola TaxID=1513793 RepID=A0A1Y6CF57_9BACT|nr:3-isopropylmalate dehydratase large subunit [Pseudobacteriovorax antillogorgiicola]TCS51677.1 3-isopropylmalate dehydratase large subunit [Pseudobacteriovorax antillogorgiicola]SMF49012.1 3-isopropylmalate dehydratase, large subunit [Pseudobacteriovorax antillogorgiicola]
MGQTLYEKVWQEHLVQSGEGQLDQIFIDTHLIHEVTSPQAFSMLRDRGLPVRYPERTIATVDHIIPTDNVSRPFQDPEAEAMLQALESNVDEHQIRYFPIGSPEQGIVHVMAPEQGLIRPGMTVACGDSHTSTHGAFGAIAFGIGTSQVRDVLASQTLLMPKLKVRRIEVTGRLRAGVTAKDLILHIIGRLGAKGGVGFAYEYGGSAITKMTMTERMTLCNMSIEGGARCGYVNPDLVTLRYLAGRAFTPIDSIEALQERWLSYASDSDAHYDDRITVDGNRIEPMLTWGTSPDQSVSFKGRIPNSISLGDAKSYMGWQDNQPIAGTPVDVAFIGSCTNGRFEDFLLVSQAIKGHKVASSIKRALAVPGSSEVARRAEESGIADIFRDAGFEWRQPGCSMCLAMNPDRLLGNEICASSSNRNFKGRQGSPEGRTLLMSPLAVAAAAVTGKVSDPREVFKI